MFDRAGVLAPPFRRNGFMLSWTKGDPSGDKIAGPFDDAGQDLLDIALTKTGTTYCKSRVVKPPQPQWFFSSSKLFSPAARSR